MTRKLTARRLLAGSSAVLVLVGGVGLATPSATAAVAGSGTAALGPISLTLGGTVVVAGSPVVGSTVAAVSTVVPSLPTAVLSGTWLRDGTPIPGATGSTYTPTTADLGSQLTYRVTASFVGLADVSLTSSAVGPVITAGGTGGDTGGGTGGIPSFLTPPTAVVSGIQQVGQTLSAAAGTPAPLPDLLTYQWLADGVPIAGATSPDLTLTPDQLGSVITVAVTAIKTGLLSSVTTSLPGSPVLPGSFTTGPQAVVTGLTQVGSTLTALPGTISPLPDALDFQWFADGVSIPGADQATLLLTPDQLGSVITVLVTVVKTGLETLTSLSLPTTPISDQAAPGLTLTTDHASVPLGSSAGLTWSSTGADSLTASGGWTGTRASGGTASVTPTTLGTTTYTLSASNAKGTTTMQVAVEAQPVAKIVPVSATSTASVSKTLRVRAAGMYSGETYSIRVSTSTVATGRANASGVVDRTLHLKKAATARHTLVKVTGSITGRTGRTDVRTTNDAALGLAVSPRVRTSQSVKVTRLAPGEHVTLSYRGRQLLPRDARADASGTFTTTFAVGSGTGARKVSVSGTFSHRHATKSFTVLAH